MDPGRGVSSPPSMARTGTHGVEVRGDSCSWPTPGRGKNLAQPWRPLGLEQLVSRRFPCSPQSSARDPSPCTLSQTCGLDIQLKFTEQTCLQPFRRSVVLVIATEKMKRKSKARPFTDDDLRGIFDTVFGTSRGILEQSVSGQGLGLRGARQGFGAPPRPARCDWG